MIDRNKEYIEFTKNCGDCGRRFRMKIEIPKFKLQTKKGQKEAMKFVEFFFPESNVACNQCNKRKTIEDFKCQKKIKAL